MMDVSKIDAAHFYLRRVETSDTNDTISEAVQNYAVNCGIVSSISICLTFTFVTCLNIAAENQVTFFFFLPSNCKKYAFKMMACF